MISADMIELLLDGVTVTTPQDTRQAFPGDYLGQLAVVNRGQVSLERVKIMDGDGYPGRSDMLFSSVRGGDPFRGWLPLGTILPGGRAVCHVRVDPYALEGRFHVRVDAYVEAP